MNIMQGDQYSIEFHLKIDNEEIDISAIEKVQFKVGNLLKTYIKDSQDTQVTYDSEDKLFIFPLSEDETFAIDANNAICEIRVKFESGVIKGVRLTSVPIEFASIREKLG